MGNHRVETFTKAAVFFFTFWFLPFCKYISEALNFFPPLLQSIKRDLLKPLAWNTGLVLGPMARPEHETSTKSKRASKRQQPRIKLYLRFASPTGMTLAETAVVVTLPAHMQCCRYGTLSKRAQSASRARCGSL